MYLNCGIQVLINNVIVNSIVSVEIHNDGQHIGSYCDIIFPLNARISFNNSPGRLILPARWLFNTGDHIIVNAKYTGYESYGNNGEWVKIFEGFLYDFWQTTPLKIKCLDFIYWFNLGIYGSKYVYTKQLTKAGKVKKGSEKGGTGKQWKKIDFSDLIQDVVNWTNGNIQAYNVENDTSVPYITFTKPDFSFTLVNITFSNMSAAAVLEWLKRELGFNICLTGTSLYANVASFTAGTVKLSTDRNVIESSLQSTNLTERHSKGSKGSNSVFLRIKLKVYFENDDGTKDSFEIGDPNGILRECYFYKVEKGSLAFDQKSGQMLPSNYIRFAYEALNQCYQRRYTGEVETYLYPVINLYDRIIYNDIRYKDRNGDYVCTAYEITCGDKGFHRKIKMAFLTTYNIVQNAS